MLKECSPKASRSISKVSVEDLPSFRQTLMQTLLDFAIHRRQNETRNRKSIRVKTMLVHSEMSRGRVMQ
jgi:hypothetical protein